MGLTNAIGQAADAQPEKHDVGNSLLRVNAVQNWWIGGVFPQ